MALSDYYDIHFVNIFELFSRKNQSYSNNLSDVIINHLEVRCTPCMWCRSKSVEFTTYQTIKLQTLLYEICIVGNICPCTKSSSKWIVKQKGRQRTKSIYLMWFIRLSLYHNGRTAEEVRSDTNDMLHYKCTKSIG